MTKEGIIMSVNGIQSSQPTSYTSTSTKATEKKAAEKKSSSFYIGFNRQELADFLAACDMPDIDTIDGENVKGEEFMEFYPDEEELRQYVMDHFYTKENSTTGQ